MDPIANMIIQLKNAGPAGLDRVVVPFSKIKLGIAEVLQKEGFIKGVKEATEKGKKVLVIDLILENRVPKIHGVKRLSKTSKRIYKKASEIRPVRSGYGVLVLSTPSGIMSGKDALKAHLGGEVLFSMW